MLGDIFQVWLGDPRYETADIAAVMAALERLRGHGVEVDYIEGNRDFFIAGSPYERYFDRVGLETAFEVDGVRYLAVHGDGLNDKDYQYRFWRWLSKSALSRFFWTRLPRRLAAKLVGSTERKLSDTNFKHKRRIPEEAIRAYAERRLAEGHDVLLLGHFHEERRWRVENGQVHLYEAWFTSRQVEWLPEQG